MLFFPLYNTGLFLYLFLITIFKPACFSVGLLSMFSFSMFYLSVNLVIEVIKLELPGLAKRIHLV